MVDTIHILLVHHTIILMHIRGPQRQATRVIQAHIILEVGIQVDVGATLHITAADTTRHTSIITVATIIATTTIIAATQRDRRVSAVIVPLVVA